MEEDIQCIKNKLDDISNTLYEMLIEIKKSNELLKSRKYFNKPSLKRRLLDEQKEWEKAIKKMSDEREKHKKKIRDKMKELGFFK